MRLPLYNPDSVYLDILENILLHGEDRDDRTGTGTISKFGVKMVFPDTKNSFPLLTTKKIHWKSVVEELLWFLRGETNNKSLKDKGVHIWDEWADADGYLGPVYGHQWRNWNGDQIEEILFLIQNVPTSRRIILNSWNRGDIPDMALPPCHVMAQWYVRNEGYLDCQMYQRSGDMFLGVPFNIASYSLLNCIFAHLTGLKPGKFTHIIGDAHIYKNHVDQVKEQLNRDPRNAPVVRINPEVTKLEDITMSEIELSGYDPHPAIKGDVSV